MLYIIDNNDITLDLTYFRAEDVKHQEHSPEVVFLGVVVEDRGYKQSMEFDVFLNSFKPRSATYPISPLSLFYLLFSEMCS